MLTLFFWFKMSTLFLFIFQKFTTLTYFYTYIHIFLLTMNMFVLFKINRIFLIIKLIRCFWLIEKLFLNPLVLILALFKYILSPFAFYYCLFTSINDYNGDIIT